MADDHVIIHELYSPDPCRKEIYTLQCHSHAVLTTVTATPSSSANGSTQSASATSKAVITNKNLVNCRLDKLANLGRLNHISMEIDVDKMMEDKMPIRTRSKSREMTPSSTRKSKGTPPMIPPTPGPLRRSDRGKKNSSSLGSQQQRSLSIFKRKKEKPLIQVTMECKRVVLDLEQAGLKRKKMNARMYGAQFKKQRIRMETDPEDGGEERIKDLFDACIDNNRKSFDSERTGKKRDEAAPTAVLEESISNPQGCSAEIVRLPTNCPATENMDDHESNVPDTPLVQVESGSHQATPVVETCTFSPEPSTVKVCNQSANIQRADSSLIAEVSVGAASEDTILLSNEQKSLHSALPGEMTRLCQTLKLSEDVSNVVRKFLEYVMKNHRVIYDPLSIVQALQLSVCWVAASITKQKINKHDTLVLAEQLLNYQCTKEQVKSVYAKLRSLKIKYLQSVDNVIDLDRDCMTAEGQIAEQNRSLTENTSTSENDENIQRAQSKREKLMKKLTRKHQQEIQKFEELWESKRKEPEKDLDSAVIRSTHSQNPNWFVKLKSFKDGFSKKMEEHNLIKQAQLKELKAKQLCAMNELRKEADLLKASKGKQLHSQSDDNAGCPQNEAGLTSPATAEPSNQSKRPSDAVCSILSAPVVLIFEDIQSAGPSKEHGCPRELSNSSNKECDEARKIVMSNDLVSQVGRLDSGGLHRTGQTSFASEQILALPDCQDLFQQQVPNDNIEQSLGSALQQASDAPVAENQNTLGRSDSVTCMTSMTDEIATPLPSSRENFGHMNCSLLVVSISGNPSPTTKNHDQGKSSEHGGAEVLYPESISTDVPAVENQSSSQIEATTSKPMDTVTSEPLVDASVGCNQAPASENLYQGGSSSQTVEHGVDEVFSHGPSKENLGIRLNNLDIGPSTDTAHGHSLESSAALQIDVGTLQPLVNQSEQSNQVVFQLGVNAGNIYRPTSLIHPTRIVNSTNSTPFLPTDPLQYQLEGIQKETEQLGLTHADMMTQLLSDRDKVIEEVHKKYQVKIQEIEAECQLKRNELDKKMNKVLMNKMVAEAFRSKSLEDLRPAGHPGIQSVAPPSVSVQPAVQRPVALHSVPPFRPSFINTASPSSGPRIGANELRPCRSPSISLTQHVVPSPFRPMVINTTPFPGGPLSIPSSRPMVINTIPPAWGPLSIPLTQPVAPRPSRVQTRGGYWVRY